MTDTPHDTPNGAPHNALHDAPHDMPQDAPNDTPNPFPGLRPFEPDETHLFFGRDGQSEELIRRLGQTRFLAVVGTSGSGKSSLVRAGLLPALHGGLMASAGSAWRVAVMRPGHDPLGNLARALASPEVFGSEDPAESDMQTALTEATLRRSSLGLLDAVRQARAASGVGGRPRLGPRENLLVVVDQFEELFRFRELIEVGNTKEDAAGFVRLLLEASAAPGERTYVVLTMRSDFLGDCAQFQGLPEAINEGQYLIPRMTRDERREAVTGPVAVADGRITEPLVNQLLNDMGDNPDQLPILQHALMRTWDHWLSVRRDGEPIDLPHYQAIGGMSSALSLHAEEAYAELSEAGRAVAEKLFKALTEKGADNREIRRPVELGEACELVGADASEVVRVVETFRRPGRSFLMPPPPAPLNADSLIDISHESLIRNWERLKKWVDEEARSARIYRRLAETAVLHKEGRAALLKDPELQIALDWRGQNNPNASWARRYHPDFETAAAFLDASVAARDAELREHERQQRREVSYKRTRLAAFILGLAVVLALLSVVYAVRQSLRAEQERERADAEALKSRRLLYPADINLAQRALEAGNIERGRELLNAHAPGSGDAPGFEWYYLWRQLHAERDTIKGPDADNVAAAVSPDGRLLAFGLGKTVEFHSLDGKTAPPGPFNVASPADDFQVSSLAFSQDGQVLAVGNAMLGAPAVKLFDAATGAESGAPREGYGLSTSIFFTPDRRTLIANAGKTVKVWDYPSMTERAGFKTGDDDIAFALSHDGARLATASAGGPRQSDYAVTLWDVASRKQIGKLGGHTAPVNNVAFSADGTLLVTADDDLVIRLWSAERRELIDRLEAYETAITSLALSADARTLVVGHDDGSLRVWGIGQMPRPLLTTLRGHQDPVRLVRFLPGDGTLVSQSSGDSGAVAMTWDIAAIVAEHTPIITHGVVRRVARSPDGRLLAVSVGDTIRLFDAPTRREALPRLGCGGVLSPEEGGVQLVHGAFSPDGKLIAAACPGQPVRLWDAATHKEVGQFVSPPGASLFPVAFSPDGRRLAAVAGVDRNIVLFDVASRKPLVEFTRGERHSRDFALQVAFSPDGRRLAVLYSDAAELWDAELGRLVARVEPERGGFQSLAFAPDGRLLALGLQHGGILLADGDRLQSLQTLKGHRENVTSLAFSKDGKRLASAGDDGTVKLWDVNSWRELVTLDNQQVSIKSLVFLPDERTIVTGDVAGRLKFWRAATDAEVAARAQADQK